MNCLNPLGVSDNKTFYCNCDTIQRYLKPNDVVYIDDGKVVGIVLEISAEGCIMEIKVGGTLRSQCQLRFSGGKHNNLPLIPKEDILDLQEISKNVMIDFLAIPLSATRLDIKKIRDTLGEFGKSIRLLAKIDSIHGVENFDELISEADGVIFVRNELHWEIPSEKLMIAQKWAIQEANRQAKPIFVQSQVMEEMIKSDQPSRKDMTEVTAVTLDGADAFIMTHETSIGEHNVEAVISLAKAIAEAENIFDHEQAYVNLREEIKEQGIDASNIDILATTSVGIAFEKESDVDMIVCITENGKIARFLSKQKPKQPILACSTNG